MPHFRPAPLDAGKSPFIDGLLVFLVCHDHA
jgi:hypothetical protein